MARKKIKKYKVSPDESICLAVSVVNAPAVESDFIYLSEQRIEKFVGVDGERKMIYGCALRPDFPIYRNNGEEEYYLEFSKDAIDKISKNYFKMGFQSNWTAAHKDEVEGLTITESWIKESPTLDKSIAIGLDADLPVGSWFIGAHCENDEIWKSVKDGTYKGFSIEAIVGLEEFEKQNDNNMIDANEMSFWTRMKEVLSEAFTTFAMAKGEETIEPIAIGDMDEAKEEFEEETPQETPTEATVTPTESVEEPKVEDTPQEPQNAPTEPTVEEKQDPNPLEELINSLKEEIKALKESNDGLTKKVKELGKKPSAEPVNTNSRHNAAALEGVEGSAYQNWREAMRKMVG